MKYITILFLFLTVKTCATHTYPNVALRGKATQSNRYDSDFGAAYNAIDGNRESNYYAGSCAVTEQQTNPWWRVDLLESYIVTSISVTNRGDCCPQRLDWAEIHVGNSLLNNGNDNPVVAVLPEGRSLTITRRVEGRYVSVVLPGSGRLLTVCEVEVYGYYSGRGQAAAASALCPGPEQGQTASDPGSEHSGAGRQTAGGTDSGETSGAAAMNPVCHVNSDKSKVWKEMAKVSQYSAITRSVHSSKAKT